MTAHLDAADLRRLIDNGAQWLTQLRDFWKERTGDDPIVVLEDIAAHKKRVQHWEMVPPVIALCLAALYGATVIFAMRSGRIDPRVLMISFLALLAVIFAICTTGLLVTLRIKSIEIDPKDSERFLEYLNLFFERAALDRPFTVSTDWGILKKLAEEIMVGYALAILLLEQKPQYERNDAWGCEYANARKAKNRARDAFRALGILRRQEQWYFDLAWRQQLPQESPPK